MIRVRVSMPVGTGQRVTLDEAQARHLRVVLRVQREAPLVVLSEASGAWHATVIGLDPMEVAILEPDTAPSPDPHGRLELWLPLLKGGKSDDLLRQLTEVGASEMVCYVASRSVAKLAPEKVAKRLERWRAIVREATRQCGRRSLPNVRYAASLPDAGPGVYFWEEGGQEAARCLERGVNQGELRLLVGPEGGLSHEESRTLDALGWRPASLGSRILRAETAVLVAATLGLAALREPGYGL